MHQALAALKNVLGYAKFADPDIKDAADTLCEQLGSELESEEYEMGSGVEVSLRELEDVLNRTDSASEDTEEAIRTASADDVVDEDEEQPTAKE